MSTLPELKDCLLTLEDRVAVLTFNRNEIRNAVTGSEIGNDIVRTIEWTNRADDVSVVVMTGTGAAFSAGGNVKNMKGRTSGTVLEVQRNYKAGVQRIPMAMEESDVPFIAAVNGSAVGAGCDIACMCDIAIGSTAAQFSETFINLGLIPGDGGSWFLAQRVGYQRAAELTFTGRMVKAAEAKELGLLMEVVEPDQLLPRAKEIAARMASRPPQALRYAKRLLKLSRRMALPEYLDLCSAFQAIAHKTEDHVEALDAFFEKRPGKFKGR